MLFSVDIAIGDIRREPASGLIAGIGGVCAWVLVVVPLCRDDDTEPRHTEGVG